MIKCGVDIVKISRIEKSVKNDSFLHRVFTEEEIEYCKNSESFAGIFAAKEAYFKALGTGIVFPMTDIEICHTDKGKPFIKDKKSTDLSISHDGDTAIAFVVISE